MARPNGARWREVPWVRDSGEWIGKEMRGGGDPMNGALFDLFGSYRPIF